MQKILTLSLIMLLGIGVSACQSQKKIDDIAEVEEWNPTGLSGAVSYTHLTLPTNREV